MKFYPGQEIWYITSRYWEYDENPPQRGVVVIEGDYQGRACDTYRSSDLYIFSDEYGHEVYIDSRRVYTTLNAACIAQLLMIELDAIQMNDHFDTWFETHVRLLRKEILETLSKTATPESPEASQ